MLLLLSPQSLATLRGPQTIERTAPERKASVAACGRRRTVRVKDTLALNALKALCGAPISMGRGETPVELNPEKLPPAAISRPVAQNTIHRS